MTRWGAGRRVTVCSGTLCPRFFPTLCASTSLCAHLDVCGEKNNNCDISAAAHLRGPGERAHKPADYLGAPRGLPSLLHKLPQLNTSYSLALSFFPRFPSCCSAFILHHRTPPAPSSLSHFSLVLLPSRSLLCTSLRFPSRCLPGVVPTWCFTPTLAIHGFLKFWQREGRQAGKKILKGRCWLKMGKKNSHTAPLKQTK